MPNDKTLRDEFAMAAITGLLAQLPGKAPAAEIVAQAYLCADLMMKERSQEGGDGK